MAVCEVELGHSVSLAVNSVAEDEIDRFEVHDLLSRTFLLSS